MGFELIQQFLICLYVLLYEIDCLRGVLKCQLRKPKNAELNYLCWWDILKRRIDKKSLSQIRHLVGHICNQL